MISPDQVLSHFDLGHSVPRESIQPVADQGLINRTWSVGNPPRTILQWVNPIFDPKIHLDIDAVTGRLAAQGLVTPRLLPTREGRLWLDDPEKGFWRLSTFIAGRTWHRLKDTSMAMAGGELVGRFHAALADWDYSFQARQRNIHDTPARFAELHSALEEITRHPLRGEVDAVAETLLRRWASWEGELNLPTRPCHGDLKVSNLRFAEDGHQAVCLVDLDTLGPQRLADEMGDAWRSWCNPWDEDDPDTCRFDVALFTASARPWLATLPDLSDDERRHLVGGIERICLELSARFLADALRNSYFREDRERFPEAGAHNLLRARCQLALAASARERRSECEAVVRGV